LIDTTGSVVGVATKVIRGSDGVIQGINLAIAAGEARRWVEQPDRPEAGQ
jgi:hypothetical protein